MRRKSLIQSPQTLAVRGCHDGGMSLLELVAALTIAASVAALGIHYLKPTGAVAHQRSCDLVRELLQNDCQRYADIHGRYPRTDLREIRSVEFAGDPLPTCPSSGKQYRIDRSGLVECPTHK